MKNINDYVFIARAFGAVGKLLWSVVSRDIARALSTMIGSIAG